MSEHDARGSTAQRTIPGRTGFLALLSDAVVTVAFWMRLLAGAVIIVLTIVTGTDVVMRYIFLKPLEWSITICMLGLVVAVLFAIPHITASNTHISMDLFYRRFSDRGKLIADTITNVAMVIFSLLVGIAAVQSALVFLNAGLRTSGSFNLPIWMGYAAVGIGFILVTLVIVLSPWSTRSTAQIAQMGDPDTVSAFSEEFAEGEASWSAEDADSAEPTTRPTDGGTR